MLRTTFNCWEFVIIVSSFHEGGCAVPDHDLSVSR